MPDNTPDSNPNDLSRQRTIPPSAGGSTPGSADQSSVGERAMPQVLGRYRIDELLGRGAMGAVYLAHDTELNRKVAIKSPLGSLADGQDFLERFRREAQAAAVLRHPNICPIYDVGEIDGIHHISMAYIEGRPLSASVSADDPLPIRRAVLLIRKVASALAEAHRHGIIHRDLKPDNIMLDAKGEPIVMDFGLARIEQSGGERLTQEGMAMGSPAYMSPEQFEGQTEKMLAACDIYSLGVMFYELLTGSLPFRGSILRIMAQVVKGQAKPPSQLRPDVDLRLDAICLKMMHHEADLRFGSMEEVVAALTKVLRADSAKASNAGSASARKIERSSSPEARPTDSRRSSNRSRTSDLSQAKQSTGVVIGGKEVSSTILLTGGGVFVGLLVCALWIIFGRGGSDEPIPSDSIGETMTSVVGSNPGSIPPPPEPPPGPGVPNLDDAKSDSSSAANEALASGQSQNSRDDGQLRQGLVAWYRFDEAQGRDVSDSGPDGHDATASADIKRIPGVFGGAIEIDQDTHIPIGDVAGFEWNEPFSLCAWIRPTSLRDNQSIVRKRNEQQRGYTMTIRRQTLCFGANHGPDGNILGAYAVPKSIVAGEWSHVAVVYDGSGRQRSVVMSVNGRPVKYTNIIGTLTASIRVPDPVVIGQEFDGQLDDVRIYNRMLSAEEVELLATPPVLQSPKTPVASADVVCEKLSKSVTPKGLHPDAAAFTSNDGWSGFQMQLPDWKAWSGSQVQFDYRQAEGSNGLVIVHPLRFGHLCVRIRRQDAQLYTMTSFPMESPSPYSIEHLPAYHRTFPLTARIDYRITSQIDEAGNVAVAINGQPVVRALYPPARAYITDGALDPNRRPGLPVHRFRFLPDALAHGDDVAFKWPPGMVGVLVNFGDGDSEVRDVRLAQTTPSSPCPVTDEQLRDGLVAWYRFDEAEPQSIVNSATGTYLDGTQLQQQLRKVDGMLGSAVEKDIEGAIWVENTADFEWNEPFSLCAWIYPLELGSASSMIIQKHDWDLLRGYLLQIHEGKLVCNIGSTPENRIDLFSGPDQIRIREWTHVAVVYDGTGRRYAGRMFLDGREESYAVGKTARLTDTIRTEGPPAIGGLFAGRLDDVRIYNRTLTSEEVEFLAAPDVSERKSTKK